MVAAVVVSLSSVGLVLGSKEFKSHNDKLNGELPIKYRGVELSSVKVIILRVNRPTAYKFTTNSIIVHKP